jgi:hypothetical protein
MARLLGRSTAAATPLLWLLLRLLLDAQVRRQAGLPRPAPPAHMHPAGEQPSPLCSACEL